MNTIDFAVSYGATPGAVMEAFWRAERWPSVAAHVTGIDMLYEDEQCQVLTMRVNSRGSHATFRTMRLRQRDRILFIQPSPPAFLRAHSGYWDIRPSAAGCVVTSHHDFLVERGEARRFATGVLGWNGRGGVTEPIGELLHANSRQTMEALRDALQATQGVPISKEASCSL